MKKKQKANLNKHGIDFADAIKIFSDIDRIEFTSNHKEERRYQTIGTIDYFIIILVVYTYRNMKRRIISARRASKKEREMYYHLR